jgi:radical SAM protein with 4Fe4S-binding SPASM domain
MARKDQLLDPVLVRRMHERGDFAGSYYVELQMAGEPTLHSQLGWFIDYLRGPVGVMVGLSTHGLLMKKKDLAGKLLDLDALTISVDSLDPVTYHKMRYPAEIGQLLENLDYLFARVEDRVNKERHIPFIELQLIQTDLVPNSADTRSLKELMVNKGWDKYAHIRTTGDCFYEMQGRKSVGSLKRNVDLCINPWTSVSVAANGDVVSCCFIFDPKREEVNWLGNLNDQSLAEIWVGPRARELRLQHKQDQLTGQCAECYLKSPMTIHQNIASRLVRLK